MKKLIVLIIVILGIHGSNQAQIGLGLTVPHPNAYFEVKSINKGVLLPRMTSIERIAINPNATALGLMVYDTDSSSYMFWNGSAWRKFSSSLENDIWKRNGNHIFNGNTGRVGIGTNTPLAKLHVTDSAVLFSSLAALSYTPDAPPISGAGARMMWYPQKAAFRVGIIDNGLLTSGFADPSVPLTAWDRDSIGQYSFAAGWNTKAKGGASVAMGGFTQATGLNSFAAGAMTIAAGNGSFAMGISNQTTGNYSWLFGTHNGISGDYSGGMGFSNSVTGQYSFAGGSNNTVSGQHSFSYGTQNQVSGNFAWATGATNSATGTYSFATGESAWANAIAAISMGSHTKATGDYSFAAGYQSNALGPYSVALGNNSMAQNQETVAIGNGNLVTAIGAIGIGRMNNVNAQEGYALGSQNTINTIGGMAFGHSNTVSGNYGTAFGSSNTISGMYATTIGLQNTAAHSFSLAGGNFSFAQGMSSFAFGEGVYAPHDHSFSIGKYNDRSEIFTPPSSTYQEKLFQIGAGTSDFSRWNALTVLKSSYTGIGISNPQAHLHILGQPGEESRIFFQNNSSSYPLSGIYLRNPDEFRFFTPTENNFNFGVGTYGAHNSRLFIQGNNGRIGISTLAPEAALDMQGMQTETQSVLFGKDDINNSFGIGFANLAAGRTQAIHTPISANLSFGYGTASNFNPVMYIQNGSQKVGIGTVYPSEKLHIVGNLRLETGTEGAGKVLTSDAFGVASWQDGAGSYWAKNGNHIYNTNTSRRVGIGTNSPLAGLHVADSGVLFSTNYYPSSSTTVDPPAVDFGTMFLWYPQKAAFRVGQHLGNSMHRDSIGIYSMALGYNLTARGNHAMVFGASSSAAEHSLANGQNVHAEGFGSLAFGQNNQSNGLHSFTLGLNNGAFGAHSTAIGSGNLVMGNYNAVFGKNHTMYNNYSALFGEQNTVGDYSMATGRLNSIATSYSFTSGESNYNQGMYSGSIGYHNETYGNYSFSGGLYSKSYGYHSLAFGNDVIARAQGGVAIGQFNDNFDGATLPNTLNGSDRVFQIGIGLNDFSRNNAMTVLRSGHIGIGKTNPTALLDVNGTGYFENELTAHQNLTVGGQLNVTGNTYITGSLYENGKAFFNQKARFYDTLAADKFQLFSASSFSPGMVLTTDLNGVGTWQWAPSSNWVLFGNDLTNENTGNVGIGTFPMAKFHVLGTTRLDGQLQIADGTQGNGKVLTSDLFGNSSWQTPSTGLWAANGSDIYNTNTNNVGIGTSTPAFKLDLANGTIGYGNNNSRTETRDNAGLQGTTAQSGFFETSNPIQYPAGASSWWHMIDVRHSNTSNNYAMQIAGSFFDQDIWFRKTNNNAAQAWSRFITSSNINSYNWTLLGNSGTNATSNFIGTTDAVDLVMRTSNLERLRISSAGNVGINQSAPAYPLNFANALGDKISLWGNTAGAAHYGIGVQSGLLQLHTDIAASNIVFGYGSSSTFNERVRIINSGSEGMTINGRVSLKNGTSPLNLGYTPGIWYYKPDNSTQLGFIGTVDNQNLGFYGGPVGWGLVYDAVNSRVGVGTTTPAKLMEVIGSGATPVTLVIGNRSGFGSAQMEFVSDYGLSSQWRPGYIKSNDLGGFTGSLEFYTNGTGAGNLYGTVKGFEVRNGAALTATGAVGAYSDARIKHDISIFEDGLNIIRQINPIKFYYNADAPFAVTQQQIGIIAQELEKIAPYMVEKNKEKGYEDLRSVNPQAFTYLLINAVKEQQNKIDHLEEELKTLQLQMKQILAKQQ